MKDYQAKVPVTLRDGKVVLTDEQLRRRESEVAKTRKKGVYAITGECRFKAGERFSWDGEIPKSMADDLSEVDDEVDDEAGAGDETVDGAGTTEGGGEGDGEGDGEGGGEEDGDVESGDEAGAKK